MSSTNIFLLGATGGTGKEILKRMIADGYNVKALVRAPSKIKDIAVAAGNLKVIEGELYETDKLVPEFDGCDVIISALGTGKDNSYTEIYSQGGRNILKAMRASGVKKLITITSGLVDLSDPSTDNFFMNRIIRPNFNKVYYDQTRWETVLDDTHDIDWICVRPTNLTNKSFTGKYRVNLDHCPPKGWKISRADLADFIVKQITSDEYIHKKPVVAY